MNRKATTLSLAAVLMAGSGGAALASHGYGSSSTRYEESTAPATLTDYSVHATDDNRIVLEGTVNGTYDRVTFRISRHELTGQTGYFLRSRPNAQGRVYFDITDFNHTDPRFWQLEIGGGYHYYGEVFASGDVGDSSRAEREPLPTPDPTPTPTPTQEPTTGPRPEPEPTQEPTTEPSPEPEPTQEPTPAPAPPADADLENAVFYSDFAQDGVLGNYAWTNPPGMVEGRDHGVTSDPSGADRRVAYFDSSARLTNGNSSPRASVVTGHIIEPGQEYWNEFSFYLPADQALDEGSDWTTLGTSAYGAPYGGASPTGLMLVRPGGDGPHVLRLGNDHSLLGDSVEIPTDTWVTVTSHFKAAENGFLELWVDTGNGPERARINGQDGNGYDVVRDGVNDGGRLYSSIGVYGNEPRRVYFADQAIGSTESSANIDGVTVSGSTR